MPAVPPGAELQFRLRTLILVVTLAAVLLAIGAPWVRSLDPQPRSFVIRWAVIYFLLLLAMYLGVNLLLRFNARRAGPRLLSTRGVGSRTRNRFVIAGFALMLLFMAGSLLLGVYLLAEPPTTGQGTSNFSEWELNLLQMNFMGIIFCSGPMILFGLDLRRPHICEHGYMVGINQLYPWRVFHRWSWKSTNPNSAMLWGAGVPLEFKSTPQEKELLAELLDRFVPASPAGPPHSLEQPPTLHPPHRS